MARLLRHRVSLELFPKTHTFKSQVRESVGFLLRLLKINALPSVASSDLVAVLFERITPNVLAGPGAVTSNSVEFSK